MSASKSLQGSVLYDVDGSPVAIVLDGGVYRLQTVGKILDAGGSQVNPATQETLASLEAKDFATQTTLVALEGKDFATQTTLAALEGKDFATQTTLASLEGKDFATQVTLASLDSKDFATQTTLSTRATEATLAAIKDTDGIKQIVDPLPAGTNNIGAIDVASSVLPAGAATEATLAGVALETTLSSIEGNIDVPLSTRATEATVSTLATEVTVATLATSANQTNGLQKAIIRSGVKGSSISADITSNPVGVDVEALHTSPQTLPPDAATETTLATRSTEATLSGLRADFNAEDFATETTLATRATETTLTGLRSDFNAEDFATETTLATRATEASLTGFRSDFNAEDFATETTLATRATADNQTNKAQFTRITDGTNDVVVDASGDLQIIHTDALPAGDNWLGRVKVGDGTNIIDPVTDAQVSVSALHGVLVLGKDSNDAARMLATESTGILRVASQPAQPPAVATVLTFAVNDALLDVGSGGAVPSPHTSLGAIIGNGINVYLQSAVIGTEGDTSENGSVIELYWRTAGPIDHLISRFYVAGESLEIIYPDIHTTRDGTVMVGDGVNTRLIVVRRRLSAAALEIDFDLRGYTI